MLQLATATLNDDCRSITVKQQIAAAAALCGAVYAVGSL
jgi:hypothetical protein